MLQVEDNVPLDETYVPNKAKWCSVCSSSEHLAHNCLQAVRYMGSHLPTVKIASYLPWYKIDPDKPKVVNSTDYSMMSFSEDFSFNWSSAVTENCHGFYNRFKEITGLMSEELANDIDCELESVRRERKKIDDEVVEEVDLVVADVEAQDSVQVTMNKTVEDSENHDQSVSLNNFSFTKEMEKIEEDQRGFQLHLEENDQRMENVEPVIFEDHRREITEMAERIGVTEEEILSVRSIKFPIESDNQEMDFIPLEESFSNEPKPGPSSELSQIQVHMQVQEEKTDAKVFLTKEHSKFLLNEGESFLHEASQKYDLQLRVVWENVGNMLLMHGLPSKQNIFYNELLDFLRNVSLEDHIKNRNNAFTMPKDKDKLIKFILEHLQRLKTDKKSLTHLKDLVRKMNNHQKQEQFKSADKLRRQLNTFLLGKNGLRDGKMHLVGIIKQYQSLKEDKPGCETPEFREELRQHFLYLFTAYDHKNYDALLDDYEECVQKGRWPIPLRTLFNIGNMIQMANDENVTGTDTNAASTSKVREKNDSSLFFEDNVGERYSIVSAVGHTDDPGDKDAFPPSQSDIIEPLDDHDQSMEIPEVPTPKQSQAKIPLEPVQCSANPKKNQPVPTVLPQKTPEKSPKHKDTPATSQPNPDSINYSAASRQIISEATSMFTLMNNQKAIAKLKLVEQKANKNQITEEDYQSLLHIQKIVQSKIASTPSTT